MNDLLRAADEALTSGNCLRLVLSAPRHSAPDVPNRLTIRPVELREGLRYQVASQVGRQERHENVTAADAAQRVRSLFPQEYRNCHLFTPEADITGQASRKGQVRVQQGPPTLSAGPATHNRAKQYLIPEGIPCPFLAEIGVMTPAGQVKASRYAKFRQINRFLELVEDVVPHLPAEGTLQVVDFGCGKSYLTFALHHLLAGIHGREVDILGYDREASVIERCREVTRKLELPGLRFEVGDILSHDLPEPVHLSVSLHACDTATDAALARAVERKAEVILAVPCCQHELAAGIHNEAIAPLHAHGILHERFASLATDALRANMLEICGYDTQVVEFIDMEHTAKNILIRATRRAPGPRSDELSEAATAAYRRFKEFLGLGDIALERALRDADIAQIREFF